MYVGAETKQTNFPYMVPGIVGFSHYKAHGGTMIGTICKNWANEGVNGDYTTYRLFENLGRHGCLSATQQFAILLWEDRFGIMQGRLVLRPKWMLHMPRFSMVRTALPFYALRLVGVRVGTLILNLPPPNILIFDTGTSAGGLITNSIGDFLKTALSAYTGGLHGLNSDTSVQVVDVGMVSKFPPMAFIVKGENADSAEFELIYEPHEYMIPWHCTLPGSALRKYVTCALSQIPLM